MGKEPKKFDFPYCVDTNLQNTMGKLLGCVPPWMSMKNQCKSTFNYSMNEAATYLRLYILKLTWMKPTTLESQCEYCESSHFVVSVKDELNYDEGWGKNGDKAIGAIIFFDQVMTVTETVYNYDTFKFLVDVGSSFGTWLGLSMLSINYLLDLIVNYIKDHDICYICRRFKSVTP